MVDIVSVIGHHGAVSRGACALHPWVIGSGGDGSSDGRMEALEGLSALPPFFFAFWSGSFPSTVGKPSDPGPKRRATPPDGGRSSLGLISP